MIGDEVIQASIIAKIKSLGAVTSLLSNGATEVRELEWQGTSFSYPNVRIELEDNDFYFDEQTKCSLQRVEWSVYIFSQQDSSKECSQIKTAVINALVGSGFSNQTYNTKFSTVRLVENIPAVREDARTWRAQVKLSSKVTARV